MRSTLSFCAIDGALVFLDIAADRYFMLSRRDDDLVRSLIDRPIADWPDEAKARLRQLGFLADPPESGAALRPMASLPCLQDHRADPARSANPGTVASVAWQLFRIRRALDRGRLAQLLDHHGAARRTMRPTPPKRRLTTELSVFAAARMAVPIRHNCLLDSLALCVFLASRAHHATLVIGVRIAPFRAHAWVQQGTALLNDDCERVNNFTPIRIA